MSSYFVVTDKVVQAVIRNVSGDKMIFVFDMRLKVRQRKATGRASRPAQGWTSDCFALKDRSQGKWVE